MEDRFSKYLRLFGSIFFLVIGFIVSLILLLVAVKLLFGLLSYIPWFTYAYMIFIILVPAGLFIPAYIIYFKRTATHPAKYVRWISYLIFTVAIIIWSIFLVLDMITFFKYAYASIGMYRSYDMIFLAINVASFFLVGIMQAFTTKKEQDWMERVR